MWILQACGMERVDLSASQIREKDLGHTLKALLAFFVLVNCQEIG